MNKTLEELGKVAERLRKANEKNDWPMVRLWERVERKLQESLEKQKAWLKGKNIGNGDLFEVAKHIFGKDDNEGKQN